MYNTTLVNVTNKFGKKKKYLKIMKTKTNYTYNIHKKLKQQNNFNTKKFQQNLKNWFIFFAISIPNEIQHVTRFTA